MRTLILGGEGFIGSHLVDNIPGAVPLDDRSFSKHRFDNTVLCDVSEYSDGLELAINGSDLVIHAACSDIRASQLMPYRDATTNVLGALVPLSLCRVHKKPMLYISSVSVHSEASHYAISKFAAERYCMLYRQWIDTCIIRLSNVFGPRDTESVIAKWISDDEIKLINAGATRDFVYIKDVVEAVKLAITHWPSKTLDIGTGVETKLGDLAKWISEKRNVSIVPAPRREIDNVVDRVVDWIPAWNKIGFRADRTVYQALNEMGICEKSQV